MTHSEVHFQHTIGGNMTDRGSSPDFITNIEALINAHKDEIVSFDAALYLFNNMPLYNVFADLASNGCRTTIYSLPLEGYDTRPGEIYYYGTNRRYPARQSKFDLAEALYSEIRTNASENFELRIVPHIMIRWSGVRGFSRGNLPYSLHTKTFCLKLRDGTGYAGITSSNLAVRDLSKFEILEIVRLDADECDAVLDFYAGLRDNSYNINEFDENGDYSHFNVTMRNVPANAPLKSLAPFYLDSPVQFEDDIINMVNAATRRIVVCAEHICAYDYWYTNSDTRTLNAGYPNRKDGFIAAVIQRCQNGVQTSFMSQTYADSDGDHRYRAPENRTQFINFINNIRNIDNCSYYQNNDQHTKFIVADDKVLITTCNFTPTQFIYLPHVDIPQFENIPDASYSGIHCEHGAYVIIEDHNLAEQVLEFFELMKNTDGTRQMF